MSSRKLSPIFVERLLIACFAFIILLLVADFIFFSSSLKTKARDLQTLQVTLNSTSKDLQDIKTQEENIQKNQSKIDKLSLLIGEIKEYQYQNEIIEDLSVLVKAVDPSNGISSYAFSSLPQPGTTPTASTPAPTPSTGQATPSPTPQAAPIPAGLEVIEVSISINNMSYDNYLRLVQLFENNVMRVQLKEVSLSPEATKRNDITKETMLEKLQLVLTIYTRKNNGS